MRGRLAVLLLAACACSKPHSGGHEAPAPSAAAQLPAPAAPAYTHLAGFSLNASSLAQDDANLYVADDLSTNAAFRGTITSFPKTGGPKVTLYDGSELVRTIAVDHGVVFVLSRAMEGGVFTLAGGKLTPLKVEGAARVQLSLTNVLTDASLGNLTAGYDRMVVDATSVYLAGSRTGDVGSVPRKGGTLKTLAKASAVTSLAADATSVYFTTAGGDVVRVPKAGGAPTTLASGRSQPGSIAVEGDRVVWTEGALTEDHRLFQLRGGGAPEAVDLGEGWRNAWNPALAGGDLLYTAQDKWASRSSSSSRRPRRPPSSSAVRWHRRTSWSTTHTSTSSAPRRPEARWAASSAASRGSRADARPPHCGGCTTTPLSTAALPPAGYPYDEYVSSP